MTALEGILVIDASQLMPGSLCGQMLADLGARVIKLEGMKGDGFRQSTPLVGASGSYFQILNRNKEGLCLNLKEEEGRNVLRQIIRKTDVFIESCRPGTMDDIGLGYDDFRELNPRLVYCSLTGFGQNGPYRDRAAHDINLAALAGVLDLLGGEKGRPPVPSIQIGGAGGGSMIAAIGILAALIRRMKNGKGQYLDVGILDGLTPFMSLAMSQHLAGGELSPEEKNRLKGGYASYNVYMTKDSRYITVGCLEESTWREFCQAIKMPGFIPDLHAAPDKQEEMKSMLEKIFREKARAEWMDIFARFNTCVSPVNNLEEAANDPQVRARALWFKATHPLDGEVPQQAFPVKYREDQPGWRSHPPSLGEHTDKILREFGFEEARIRSLRELGIIF